MRLHSSLVVDEYDNFESEAIVDDTPPAHGVVRLREFSIQGESGALRRLAAAALNAADLADRETSA
jgi:hypothetical protein